MFVDLSKWQEKQTRLFKSVNKVFKLIIEPQNTKPLTYPKAVSSEVLYSPRIITMLKRCQGLIAEEFVVNDARIKGPQLFEDKGGVICFLNGK